MQRSHGSSVGDRRRIQVFKGQRFITYIPAKYIGMITAMLGLPGCHCDADSMCRPLW